MKRLLSTQANFPIAKPNCMDRCGDVSIYIPFGTTQDYYLNDVFFVTCNHTLNPPVAFLGNTNIEIKYISLEGQLHVLLLIAKDCYSQNGTNVLYDYSSITLPVSSITLPVHLTVNNTANKFTVVGCDAYAQVFGYRMKRKYKTQCGSTCSDKDDLVDGSCFGISLGIVILVLAAYLLYMELKRRKLIRMKHEFFLQNGGLLLQEKLIRRDQSPDVAKIFTSAELKKATNDSMTVELLVKEALALYTKASYQIIE
ncbi:wall-associated receptor kinase 2-like [Forsythia ovata]|uniref:Wall-associated receptor kinase 2-like n=1 Tax=Forsythia ovata TaxID=205694 RepID=A0ABD1PVL6_9LAMI